MITVQETTVWSDNYQNHQYILSDDMRWLYGFIRAGETYPKLFNKPIGFDTRGRTFKTLIKTVTTPHQIQTWVVEGSRGNQYTVSLRSGRYHCTCPASVYRTWPSSECKHIRQIMERSNENDEK